MLRGLRMYRHSRKLVRSNVVWKLPRTVANRWLDLPMSALSPLHLDCFQLISTKPAPMVELQTALARTVTVDGVLDVWEAHRHSVFTHNVVRSCLYYSLRAAKYEHLSFEELFALSRFQVFWQHLSHEVPSMSANTAIKCLYNCAQFDFNHETLAAALVDVCTQKSKSIPSVSFGILLWSLKRLDLIASSRVRPLVSHIVDLFHAKLCAGERFKPQTFSNILWVLASTGTLPEHVSEKVTECLPQYMQEFDFHSLSLCLWSLTTCGADIGQQSLDAAASIASKVLKKQRNVQSTVHCCWAFASAEYYHEPFCKALGEMILQEPSSSSFFTPRLLSCVAWMCAKVSYYDPSLLDCIARLALQKLYHFNAQDLGNLAYAYAHLNHPHQELIRAVTAQFVSDRKLMSDDHACVSIAWANLAIGDYPLPLLEHMMAPERVHCLIEKEDQNGLNFLLRLQALLQAERPELNLCLPYEMEVFASTLVESQWSHTHTNLLNSIVNALVQVTGNTSYFTLEALTTTLYSIDIEVILDSSNNPIPIPQQWLSWQNLHCLINSSVLKNTNPHFHSLLQAKTADIHSDRVILKCSESEPLNLASDWADLVGGPAEHIARKVAIEVDGPWHYATNCPHTLGKTLLKHRVLKSQGWTVLSIPYFQWQQLKTKQDQVEFLQSNLFRT